MSIYNSTSPWFATSLVNNRYLDILEIRPIPASVDDRKIAIPSQYTHRPDLMAYDLYQDFKLWWVFAQRNMDVIQDPIYDFVPGVEIYIPNAAQLRQKLGL